MHFAMTIFADMFLGGPTDSAVVIKSVTTVAELSVTLCFSKGVCLLSSHVVLCLVEQGCDFDLRKQYSTYGRRSERISADEGSTEWLLYGLSSEDVPSLDAPEVT